MHMFVLFARFRTLFTFVNLREFDQKWLKDVKSEMAIFTSLGSRCTSTNWYSNSLKTECLVTKQSSRPNGSDWDS